MKILLTGAGGMVGKNILYLANEHNHTFLSPNRLDLDLLSVDQVRSYLERHKPDLIIHAAGVVGGIQANISSPVKFLVDNMQMGINLLIEARRCGIGRVLNLASSCMYPRDAANPLSEDLILKGELEPTNEGYALAKVTSTRLCEYICREDASFLYKTIIPCNLYGPFDKFSPENSHMIPAVIRKLHEAKLAKSGSVEIWGDGEARREFMYAEDLADFIFFCLEKYSSLPQNLNVGLGFDYSINEYYSAAAEVVGFNGSFSHDLTKPVGMKQKLIDASLLEEFGWRHKTDLKEGLMKTYKFYLGEG